MALSRLLAYDLMGREEYEEIGQLIEHDYDVSAYDPRGHFYGGNVYPKLEEYISPIPLSRIAFAEQELTRFAEENGVCQYVICGAGMDTFAFRNDNRDIRVFELDHPDTQRYKTERVKELEWTIKENVRYVAIDFSKDDMVEVLMQAGYDPSLPSFFSILGVTYYLTLPVFEKTIENIGRIAKPGSRVVFDFPDETTFAGGGTERVHRLTEITAKLGEPMQHGFSTDEITDALGRHGFGIAIHETPERVQRHYFASRSDSQKAYENIHLIEAVKQEDFR